MDAELRLIEATTGNGVTTYRTFDAERGFITDIEAGTANAVADFEYTFDTLGNLTFRFDYNESLAENFSKRPALTALPDFRILGFS